MSKEHQQIKRDKKAKRALESPGKHAEAEGDDTESGTSLQVLRRFITRAKDGSLDASEIVSLQCYEAWVRARKHGIKHPEKAFQRSITAHLAALDGRSPFEADEEEAILKVLRKKQKWPCFAESSVSFGKMGFRSIAFHEKLRSGLPVTESLTNKRARSYEGDYEGQESSADESEQGTTVSTSSTTTTLSHAAISLPSTVGQIVPVNLPWQRQRPGVQDPCATDSSYNYEVSAFRSFLSTIPDFQGVWSLLLAFVRMRTLGRGWFSPQPTAEHLASLIQRVSQEHPGQYVHVLDLRVPDSENRMLAQNQLSVQYFGAITPAHGGLLTRRFLKEDTFQALSCVAKSHCSPGQIFSLRIRGLLEVSSKTVQMARNNLIQEIPTAMFDVFLMTDPSTQLLVERGVYICPTPNASVSEFL